MSEVLDNPLGLYTSGRGQFSNIAPGDVAYVGGGVPLVDRETAFSKFGARGPITGVLRLGKTALCVVDVREDFVGDSMQQPLMGSRVGHRRRDEQYAYLPYDYALIGKEDILRAAEARRSGDYIAAGSLGYWAIGSGITAIGRDLDEGYIWPNGHEGEPITDLDKSVGMEHIIAQSLDGQLTIRPLIMSKPTGFKGEITLQMIHNLDVGEGISIPTLEVGMDGRDKKGQDVTLVDKKLGLYGVLDGVGSHPYSGPLAKAVRNHIGRYNNLAAVTNLRSAVDNLRDSASYAQKQVEEARGENGPIGSTTAAITRIVSVNGRNYLIAMSIGDSRIYARNGSGQVLTQISRDEAFYEKGRRYVSNVISNSGGFGGVRQLNVMELKPGSEVVIMTDGISGEPGTYSELPLGIIDIILRYSGSSEAAAQNLVKEAMKIDDRRVIVIRS